jgi:hypothetical protein
MCLIARMRSAAEDLLFRRSRTIGMASRIAIDVGAPTARTDHTHTMDSSAFCF